MRKIIVNSPKLNDEDVDNPIGGGGLPPPKERVYIKLPVLSIKQTFKVFATIPLILFLTSFVCILIVSTTSYQFSYESLKQISGYSLLVSIHLLYTGRALGYCKFIIISIYGLIALSILSTLYTFFKFNFYFEYALLVGSIVTFLIFYFYKNPTNTFRSIFIFIRKWLKI